MDRVCAKPGCGGEIPPPKGRSAPRKFCLACRPPRNRPDRAPSVVVLPDRERRSTGLVATYRHRLEQSERLDTPEGEHVILLVEMLAAGGHTASGAAALSKELRAAMDAALAGAPTQADALDELRARRDRKASGA